MMLKCSTRMCNSGGIKANSFQARHTNNQVLIIEILISADLSLHMCQTKGRTAVVLSCTYELTSYLLGATKLSVSSGS